jgi:hypothetical protein
MFSAYCLASFLYLHTSCIAPCRSWLMYVHIRADHVEPESKFQTEQDQAEDLTNLV